MTIGILAAKFPPDQCGVADYTEQLIAEIFRQDHSVHLWTMQTQPRAVEKLFYHRLTWPIDSSNAQTMLRELKSAQITTLIVQFTPYLFPLKTGRRPLALLLRQLQKSGIKIILLVHEAHFPVQMSLRGFVYGIPQFLHFHYLCQMADQTVFTYDCLMEKWRRRLPQKNISWLPVGSNILPRHSDIVQKARTPHELLLLHFGGQHPTRLFDFIFKALERARHEIGPHVRLALVGISPLDATKRLKESGYAHLQDAVSALGFLESGEVSSWLSHADLVLSPFLDGVSTRRGSVMAALAHGAPVLTTEGWATGHLVPWHQFVLFSPSDNLEGFCQSAIDFLRLPLAERRQLGQHGQAYYRAHFEWSIIAAALQSQIRAGA